MPLAPPSPFKVNATRIYPYLSFKFLVAWDNRYVAGVSKVSALRRTTEVVEHRHGGDPSTPVQMPGRNKYEAVTLERGVTQDLEFEKWAFKCWSYANAQAQMADKEVSLADFCKDMTIELHNEAGQKVVAYHLYRCWVSEYQALPDLDANANAVAIAHLRVVCHGWIRDTSVTELKEPSFNDPAS